MTDKQEEPISEPETQPADPLINIDHFAQVVLKTGVVVSAEAHPNADRLLVMQVNIGEETPRQIVAGIREDWAPGQIVGRRLIVCCNLKPAKLRGVESHGMMLAVRGNDQVWPVGVDGDITPGTRVT
ncbi:MAG: methionyl-tRNA synthetase [Planctomycetota bacterium]|jgi:methionyl-tRNA synthetase